MTWERFEVSGFTSAHLSEWQLENIMRGFVCLFGSDHLSDLRLSVDGQLKRCMPLYRMAPPTLDASET